MYARLQRLSISLTQRFAILRHPVLGRYGTSVALNDQNIQRIAAAGRRLRIRSALNPILWLCSTVSAPLLLAAIFADTAPTWLLVVFVVIAAAPVFTAVLAFAYFARTAPGRLQSEDYQIRAQLLNSIQEKGNLLEDGRSVELILNPQSGSLANKSEEDQ